MKRSRSHIRQPPRIIPIHRVIVTVDVFIRPIYLPKGILGNKPSNERVVVSSAEEDKPRLGRVFLGLVGVFGCQRAILGGDVAEGVVVVGLDDRACGVGYLVEVTEVGVVVIEGVGAVMA